MTPTERKKILDWINGNTFRDPDFDEGVVRVNNLTAFIESLSTEEAEVLQEGDWFYGSADQINEVWNIGNGFDLLAYNPTWYIYLENGSLNHCHYKRSDFGRQLPPEEFLIRARNTFNNPKP